MSNSALISGSYTSHTKRNSPRNKPITKITPHHAAGNLTFEGMKNIIKSSREMSCNYIIQTDGKIYLFVNEADRSWCSSSPANDHQAITIEVANDGGAPNWHVSDAALASLIDLCTDICQRNGIKALNFTGNANGNLTQHNYFASTACPGPYLKSKFSYIAQEVNRRLASGESASPVKPGTTSTIYRVRKTWADAKTQIGAFSALDNAKAVADKNKAQGYKVFDANGNTVYDPASPSSGTTPATFEPYRVQVTATSLNIRKGPGTNYGINGVIKDKGTYTIIEEATGTGASKWGRLKSGAGWIGLDLTKKL